MSLSNAIFNRLLNPVVRRLLRSRLHGLASGNVAILHYTGRKSGRALDTPLSYARDGDVVRVMSSQNTNWWKNFRGRPAPVEVEIGGERYGGTATLYEGDSEPLRAGVRKFLTALPRDAVVYGIKLDRDKQPTSTSLDAQAPRLVLVEIQLS
jgi:hypothetical protein